MSADTESLSRRAALARYSLLRAGLESVPPHLVGDGPRAIARRLVFAYLDWSLPESPLRGADEAAALLDAASASLLALQREDGTIDCDNLRSPPDTAFVVEVLEDLLKVASLEPEPSRVSSSLGRASLFCDRAAAMLARSGVHTPNHRWVLCGALARSFARTGQSAYRSACLDWLGEGIDLDADGQFSERSSGVYTPVTCVSLIRAADGLGMSELLDPARRALESSLKLIQPGGEIETIASRRQDQAQVSYLSRQTFPFAYFAALDDNPRFAWAAALAAQESGELAEQLPLFLAYAPSGTPSWGLPAEREAVDAYTAYYANSGLVRMRSGDMGLSLYGGTDIARDPSLPDASGIASNPSILTFRSGEAVCRWLRLRPLYFDLPSARFLMEGFDGEAAMLRWERTVPYYGPLPVDKRRLSGDYGLSTGDGRYWSKMSFADRPRRNECRLAARVLARLVPRGCSLEFVLEANASTPAFLDLAFDAECRIEAIPEGGLRVSRGAGVFFVTSGGCGRWREISGASTGEAGRHSSLGDGEGRAKALVRWAFEFEAPCRFRIDFAVT